LELALDLSLQGFDCLRSVPVTWEIAKVAVGSVTFAESANSFSQADLLK